MEGGARELLVRHAAGLPLEIHYRTKSGDWVYNYTLETARKVADYSYHTPDIREHGIEIKSRNVREDEIRGRTPRIIIGVQVEVAKASGEIRGHILYVVRSDDLLQWADDHHAWRPDKHGNPWMYAPVSFSSAERKRLWEKAISS